MEDFHNSSENSNPTPPNLHQPQETPQLTQEQLALEVLDKVHLISVAKDKLSKQMVLFLEKIAIQQNYLEDTHRKYKELMAQYRAINRDLESTCYEFNQFKEDFQLWEDEQK